jgi:hypothetical protein
MEVLKQQQNEMTVNLTKFNTFIKEKELKVEKGIRTEREERETREQMNHDIEEKEHVLVELTASRVIIKPR